MIIEPRNGECMMLQSFMHAFEKVYTVYSSNKLSRHLVGTLTSYWRHLFIIIINYVTHFILIKSFEMSGCKPK